MQTHTYKKTLRMSDRVAEGIKDVSNMFRINESEYMRRAITERLEQDLKNYTDNNKEFIFI